MGRQYRHESMMCTPETAPTCDAPELATFDPHGNAAAQEALQCEGPALEPTPVDWDAIRDRTLLPEEVIDSGDIPTERDHDEGPLPPRERIELGEGGISNIEYGDWGVDVNLLDISAEGRDRNGTEINGPQIVGSFGQLNHRDHTDDDRRWGARGRIGLARANMEDDDGNGLEIDTPSIYGEISGGEDGFTFGGGMNLLSGATQADVGESGRLRAGAGLGAGWQIRGHWGDDDGDHVRDIGLGVDVGPLTFDGTTEGIHEAWNAIWD